MARRTTGLVLGLLALLGCGSRGSPGGGGTSAPTNQGNTDHVALALSQINASRATKNLPALTLDASMSSCALRHAQDCAGCAGFQLSGFAACAHRDFKAGDTCGGNSENQGVASGGTEDQGFTRIHEGMMAEGPPPPGEINHYSNIMDPTATAVGLGLFVDSNGALWVSEEFR